MKIKKILIIIISLIILMIVIFFSINKFQYNQSLQRINKYVKYESDSGLFILPKEVLEIKLQSYVYEIEYDILKKESYFLLSTSNIKIDKNKFKQNDYEYMIQMLKENKETINKKLKILPKILEDNNIKKKLNKVSKIQLENTDDFLNYTKEMIELYMYILKNYTMDKIINKITEDVHLGFVYWNPNTDEKIKQNENEIFLAASTYKLGVALQIADGVHNGKYKLSDKVKYTSPDYGDGAGIIQYEPYGTTYTVNELLQIMIHYSDNVATHMLIRYIGEDKYQSFMDEVTNNNYTFKGNEITPQAGFCLVKKLYLNEQNNPMYDKLILYMKNTIYEDRISLYLDNEIVAHKIGDYGIYTNDIGIVLGNNPFVVSYYCKGYSEDCKQAIGEMSYIFNYYSGLEK